MTQEYGPRPLKPLNTKTRHGFEEQYNSEQFLQSLANDFIFYFDDTRHRTNGNPVPDSTKIEDKDDYYQPILDWKIVKERQKTVSAALLLCLNLGVDPPDVIKPHPCARIEAGIDPLSFQDSKKAIEQIGKMLQTQYETLSLRTRYKQSLDPCVEDVKRFCTSLRRTSKDDRILFHYNGHGVPQPTPSGEIWVFNRGYTQYIPISLYDLQTWLGAPSIFVWDCNSANNIVDNFKKFAHKRVKDEQEGNFDTSSPSPVNSFLECYQLASCRSDELLLMSPELPADLFTCCLTCPIDISIKIFLLQSPLKDTKYKILFENPLFQHNNKSTSGSKSFRSSIPNVKIPGVLSDRRSPLGELNWIFTAITDTIAWSSLPRKLFKKLFRHDLMVAALFRNFLLAKRVMPLYNCHPTSYPELPDSTVNHPLWKSWDVAIDEVLSKLVEDMKNNSNTDNSDNTVIFQQQDSFQPSNASASNASATPSLRNSDTRDGILNSQSRFAVGNLSTMSLSNHPASRKSMTSALALQQHKQYTGFFEQNLTAFELWLKYSSNKRQPPEQLPIVLQVLLSQVHRIRALVLLSRFLDLGPWAVYLSLSIGIFPYVLKLLQSPAPELKPILVFIWARIISVDHENIQSELLKEKGYMYFINILVPEWTSLGRNNSSSQSLNNVAYVNSPKSQHSSIGNSSGTHLPSLHNSNETTDDQKAMAVFTLSAFIRDFPAGQKQCFNLDLVNRLRYYIENSEVPLLRQWSVILIGQLTYQNPLFKSICMDMGVFTTIKKALGDPVPEVRTASLLALQLSMLSFSEGDILIQLKQEYEQQFYTLHNQLQQIQQSQNMEQQHNKIEQKLNAISFLMFQMENIDFDKMRKQEIQNIVEVLTLVNDGSPLVRKELLIYFSHIVHNYYSFFLIVAFESFTEEIIKSESNDNTRQFAERNSVSYGSIFSYTWKSILIAATDVIEENKNLAKGIIDNVLFGLKNYSELKKPFRRIENYCSQKRSSKTDTGKPIFSMNQIHVAPQSTYKGQENLDNNDIQNPLKQSENHSRYLNKILHTLGFNDGDAEKGRNLNVPYDSSENRQGSLYTILSTIAPTSSPFEQSFENNLPFKSKFLDYCSGYFQEPQMRKAETDEPGSMEYTAKVWRRNRNDSIITETQNEKLLAVSGDWSSRYRTLDHKTQPKLIEFAQFENYLVASDERDSITVFDWESGESISKFGNLNPYGTKITSLKFLNEDDKALLLTGSSDGMVKIFKDFNDSDTVKTVTTWRGLTDMLLTPRSSGLLLEWQQMKGYLLATGDVKIIRVWDAHSESLEVDIPAKTSSLVTSITSDQLSGNIFVCGFTDGSLRVYDRRVNARDAMVRLWRSGSGRHNSSIINVQLQRGGYRELVSGSSNGCIELWDIRSEGSINSFQDEYNMDGKSKSKYTQNMNSSTMSCLKLHEHASVIATGTKQIKIWTTSGDILSAFHNIPKYGSNSPDITTNFTTNGIRSGLSGLSSNYSSSYNSNNSFLSSLAFHPHRMMLAAANSHNSYINIYKCENKNALFY